MLIPAMLSDRITDGSVPKFAGKISVTTVTIKEVGPVSPWHPNTPYLQSSSITPQNVDDPEVTLPQNWFVCLVGGTSGASPPAWPASAGVTVQDGTVLWLNYGIYPN